MTAGSSNSSPRQLSTPFAPAASLLLALALTACSSPKDDETKAANEPKPVEVVHVPAPQPAGEGSILRLDPAFDSLVPLDAKIEKVATGFGQIEGLLWFADTGNLWFSDPPENVVRQRAPAGEITEIADLVDTSAGLAADSNGNVIIAQRGGRRIARRNRSGIVTTLVDRFEGKRLNGPGHLALFPGGTVYFTDPLEPGEDPRTDLGFSGIYAVQSGRANLVNRVMTRPAGLAFSPDGRYLYVANADPQQRNWVRFAVFEDGGLATGREFASITDPKAEGLPGGLQVDSRRNVWAAGPGGILIFDSNGKHLGSIKPNEPPSNCLFADDGKTLWIAARASLYRITLNK